MKGRGVRGRTSRVTLLRPNPPLRHIGLTALCLSLALGACDSSSGGQGGSMTDLTGPAPPTRDDLSSCFLVGEPTSTDRHGQSPCPAGSLCDIVVPVQNNCSDFYHVTVRWTTQSATNYCSHWQVGLTTSVFYSSHRIEPDGIVREVRTCLYYPPEWRRGARTDYVVCSECVNSDGSKCCYAD